MNIEAKIRKLEKLNKLVMNIFVTLIAVLLLALSLIAILTHVITGFEDTVQFLSYTVGISGLSIIFLVPVYMAVEDPLYFVKFFKEIGADIVHVSARGVIAYLNNFVVIGRTGTYLGLIITKAIDYKVSEKKKVRFPSTLLRKEMLKAKVNDINIVIRCGKFVIPHKKDGYLEFQSKYIFVHMYEFEGNENFINFLKGAEVIIDPC
ncbi:MAG: hypothetical protein ACP6IU_14905 [Candidatus Asgardarchaeia archaeon]